MPMAVFEFRCHGDGYRWWEGYLRKLLASRRGSRKVSVQLLSSATYEEVYNACHILLSGCGNNDASV